MFAANSKLQERRRQIWPKVTVVPEKTGYTRRFLYYFVITVLVLGWGCAAGFFFWRTTPTYALFKAAEMFLKRDEKSFKKYVDVPSIVHHAKIEIETLVTSEADQHSGHPGIKNPLDHRSLTGKSKNFETEVDRLLNEHFHRAENGQPDFPGKGIGKSDNDILKLGLILGFYLGFVDLDYVETRGSTGRVRGFLVDPENIDKKIDIDLRLEKRAEAGWVLTECKNISSISRIFIGNHSQKIHQKRTYSIKGDEFASKLVWLKTSLKVLFFTVFFRFILRRFRIYRIDPSMNSNDSYLSSRLSHPKSKGVTFQFGLAFKSQEFLIDFPFGTPVSAPTRDPSFKISQRKSIDFGHERTANTNVDSKAGREPSYEVPRGVEVYHEAHSIRIVYKWQNFPPWLPKSGKTILVITGIIMLICLTIEWGPNLRSFVIWLILFYRFACDFLNKTILEISSLKLEVRHQPLPWGGNRKFDTQTLSQVYAVIKKDYSEDTEYYRATVNALLTDGRKIKLLGSGLNREKATFIAEILQQHLRLGPHPVVRK